jgi:hypothetical protein
MADPLTLFVLMVGAINNGQTTFLLLAIVSAGVFSIKNDIKSINTICKFN